MSDETRGDKADQAHEWVMDAERAAIDASRAERAERIATQDAERADELGQPQTS